MAKVEEEIKLKHLLCWSGEHEIELFNSWDMSAEELKKKTGQLQDESQKVG